MVGGSDSIAIAASYRDYLDSAADSNTFDEFNDKFTKLTNCINIKDDVLSNIDMKLG